MVVNPGAGAVSTRIDGVTHHITLVRPALDDAMVAELHDAIAAASRDRACRAIVLAGTDGVFCTGLDLREREPGSSDAGRAADGGAAFFDLLRLLVDVPRLTVALVDGPAQGGGVGIAAACDIVYATPIARFALPEALWSLLPCSVLPFLVRRIGPARARVMTLRTAAVDAATAMAWGLVDEVVADHRPALGRLRARAGKLDETTIGAAKAYLARFSPITDADRDAAVETFAGLLSDPRVRAGIDRFAATGRGPWEG